jgi:hypothetical protein
VAHVRDLAPDERRAFTKPAREAALNTYAARNADDPAKLAKAVRIVRVALERKRLTLAEVLPVDKAAA